MTTTPPLTMNALLLAHRPSMLAWARKLCRNHADADDVVQTACVYALTSTTPAADVQNPKAWLNTCVRNAYREMCATETRYMPGGDELVANLATEPTQLMAVEIGEAMAVVATMSDRRQDAFHLVVVEEHTRPEAAAILGVWQRSVDLHVKNARLELAGIDTKSRTTTRRVKRAA